MAEGTRGCVGPGARADTMMLDGRALMRGGKLVGIDEKKIDAQARKLAAKFWKRF